MKIALISCSSKKQRGKYRAIELYNSPLFKFAISHSRNVNNVDKILILSSKYGILRENEEIEYYDESLNGKNKDDRITWSKLVLRQLKHLKNNQIYIYAGKKYHENITEGLKENNNVHIIYDGETGIGKILSKLKREIKQVI